MSASNAIVVAAAARTAVGSFNGSFANTPAHELGIVAIKDALGARQGRRRGSRRSDPRPGADRRRRARTRRARRRSAPASPKETTAWGLNQVCGSGLRAIALGMQQIASGDAKIIVAGGQESMSMSPHCQHLRAGTKMGDLKIIDTMIKDGLWDAFNGYHMGNTAENVARQFQITRDEQDEFAVASQNKAEAAQKAGRFKDEIVAVTVKGRKGDTVVDQDEYIRHGATLDAMQKLQPGLRQGRHGDGRQRIGPQRRRGGRRADDARPKPRGAASRRWCASFPGRPPASIRRSWAPAPFPRRARRWRRPAGRSSDLDLVEANEAFAAQACAVNKDMGWNPDIVNVNGGAIAIGHPIGASGARIFNTLVYEMRRRGAKKGLATLCIGGGMGVAMCVESMQ